MLCAGRHVAAEKKITNFLREKCFFLDKTFNGWPQVTY